MNVPAIPREWSRLLSVFIHMADEHLAGRLELATQLPERERHVVVERYAQGFSASVSNSALWDNFFDLNLESRRIREGLKITRRINTSTQILETLAFLQYTERSLDRWNLQRCANVQGKHLYSLMSSFH